MIRLQGLHKFFNKGRQNEIHVINDISLELPERGMVAIFGPSGCGKTTLLNVIGGLDKYAEGTLTVEGQSIREHTDIIRNQYIGYIFQNYNLNRAETCFENVADALRLCGMTDEEEIHTRVMAALTNVGMEKYAKRTPDTLSGGQQQRIAIARAIVKNPRIILADEPTGNLDEANTVMIMDLLKAIAKNHLVLLVTHEANLVDYYCDTVIELRDGRVVSQRQNTDANGFFARDRNDIWLGELSRHDLSNDMAEIEYYGDKPEVPIRLKIVNNGGKLYVKVGTAKVQILDEGSEVKLREGVYEEKRQLGDDGRSIDMSELPPVQGHRFGRLFSLGSSIKSGYNANFKSCKRGKRVLRSCMGLFAAVVVYVSALFGTAFGDIMDAQNAYNHHVFYLYTPTAEISARLNAAVGDANTGIDYVRLMMSYPNGDNTVEFHTGSFETFAPYDHDNNFFTNAVYLDVSLTEGMRLVEGRLDDLATGEILITTKVADALLEKSTLGYITERRDLIGLVSSLLTVDGQSARIAGIVASDESAVYMTDIDLAKYIRYGNSSLYASLASRIGLEVAPGEAILFIRNRSNNVELPRVGETIKILGRDIKVVSTKETCTDYEQWLNINGIEKMDEYSWFSRLVKNEHPELTEGTEAFYDAVDATMAGERFYEYYGEYYYAELRAFYEDYRLAMSNDIYTWLYLEKGIEEAKYVHVRSDYFRAEFYKERHGHYPTQEQLNEIYDELPEVYQVLKEYEALYEDEFYQTNRYTGIFNDCTYLVSDEDYVAFSKQLGETHPSAMRAGSTSYEIEPGISKIDEIGVNVDDSRGVVAAEERTVPTVNAVTFTEMYYTVIHSSDPEKTAAWLADEFSSLEGPRSFWKAMVTPNDLYDEIIEEATDNITVNLIIMAVVLVLMSFCMYFIMRSSLMSRIKEVGIYRAIGVSKKNLVFKFFVEAVVLASLTVLIGYLVTSAFLLICMEMSSILAEIVFYPLWLAGAVLVILYAISLFFGTLPIISLLRKTPSEILAKYDI